MSDQNVPAEIEPAQVVPDPVIPTPVVEDVLIHDVAALLPPEGTAHYRTEDGYDFHLTIGNDSFRVRKI